MQIWYTFKYTHPYICACYKKQHIWKLRPKSLSESQGITGCK